MRSHGRPLAGDDAVDARIAKRAVRREPMVAKYAVKLRAKPFDGTAALMIEEVRAELDGHTAERIERVMQQHEFAFGVQA